MLNFTGAPVRQLDIFGEKSPSSLPGAPQQTPPALLPPRRPTRGDVLPTRSRRPRDMNGAGRSAGGRPGGRPHHGGWMCGCRGVHLGYICHFWLLFSTCKAQFSALSSPLLSRCSAAGAVARCGFAGASLGLCPDSPARSSRERLGRSRCPPPPAF